PGLFDQGTQPCAWLGEVLQHEHGSLNGMAGSQIRGVHKSGDKSSDLLGGHPLYRGVTRQAAIHNICSHSLYALCVCAEDGAQDGCPVAQRAASTPSHPKDSMV